MNDNTPEEQQKGHQHRRHVWLMALCCGLPIVGFLVIGLIGISMPSLETALLFVCPIGMIAMMYFMHRDHRTQVKGHNHGDERASPEPKHN